MALIDKDINSVRDYATNIKSDMEKIVTSTNTFDYVMRNVDFMTFAEGTKFGSESQENLKQLVKLINNEIKTSINKLIDDTNTFLDRQWELNNYNR